MRAVHELPAENQPSASWRRQDRLAPYLFVSPFYILFVIFFLGPTIFAIVLSFFRWSALGTPTFRGARNYTKLFDDPVFWTSVQNTLVYSAASLFWVVPLALLLAVALDAKLLRGKSFWRGMYFSPIVTSAVAVSLVFVILYNKDYGLINAPLIGLGFEPINWLGSTFWVKFSLIGLITWRWTGLTMIYFLAGLQSIPVVLYEAASIDGATSFQQFRFITLPSLRPVIIFVSVIVLIGSWQIFEEPYILTQGGPGNASISIVQYLYSRGIQRLEFGYASTVGVTLFGVVFTLSLLQLYWFGVFRSEE